MHTVKNLISLCNPYWRLMRFHKPIGIELLLWPTLWALWLSNQGTPSTMLILIFVFGATIMRAAGCIINDIADRKLDTGVERTANRPLANGEANLTTARILFCILGAMALALVLMLNWQSIAIAAVAMGLVIIYPYCKRWVYWPQFVLGCAFNAGILIAFTASQAHLPWQAWWLYACAWLWTVAYDTIYAMADRPEDIKSGIKSSAIWFGNWAQAIISVLQILMLVGLCWLGYQYRLNIMWYIGLTISALLFVYQHKLIRYPTPRTCMQAFLNNHWVGLSIFCGLILNLYF